MKECMNELWVIALTERKGQANQFILILEDTVSKRRIPLVIGEQEAQAIALALEKLQPLRPQLHDLVTTMLLELGAKLGKVEVNRVEQDVFYATIYLQHANQILAFDARPSDAIALAIRAGCPILGSLDVIEKSGYFVDDPHRDKKGSYAEYTLEELQDLLQRVLAKEDYQSAVRVREAIARRNKV